MKKTWVVPKELQALIRKARRQKHLMDVFAFIPFCYEMSQNAEIKHYNLRQEFWEKVHALYPETNNTNCLRYLPDKGVVEIDTSIRYDFP